MSKNIKLIYLDIKGRGEPIRLTLSIGNIDFEDVRLSFEEWFAYKKEGKAKFG